jgi:ParB family transcriptional regulator, chromosome partitioning protein
MARIERTISMNVTERQVERISIEPQRLLVDLNVRLNANLNKEFVASIKDHGVLQPIMAVHTSSGDLRVRYGHRRTLAAIEAGLELVPVEVMGDEGTDDADAVERIITQHAENAHRSALTSSEEVHIVEQLAAFGLSAGQIQKRTHMKRPTVAHAMTVASSDLAKAAMGRYEFLSLEKAAAVAEFDAEPDAVKALVTAAKSGRFDHVAQRLRDERTERAARAVIEGALAEAGVPIVERPSWQDAARRLSQIRINGEPLSEKAHHECDGHAAFIEEHWVSGDDERTELVAVYVCTDPKAYGNDMLGHETTLTKTMTPEETEAARDERRKVLANIKAWRSSEKVRRDWLRGFLKRKTPPKGAVSFLTAELAAGGHELRKAMERRHSFGCEVLAIASGDLNNVIERASEARRQVIAFGLALAALEADTGVHTWRNPSAGARRLLLALSEWGYGLSDIERTVIETEVGK